jgi:hypothetical protein
VSIAVALESLDGFRYPNNRQALKHFESTVAASESLDGVRYPIIDKPY